MWHPTTLAPPEGLPGPPRGGDSIAGRARLTADNPTHAERTDVQGTFVLFPTGPLFPWNPQNTMSLVRCTSAYKRLRAPWRGSGTTAGPASPAGDGPLIPWLKPRGVLAHVL